MIRLSFLPALAAVTLLGMTTAAQAAPVQFAGYTQKDTGQPVAFTNASGDITSISYNATFQYTNVGGLAVALQAPIDATVTITLTGAGTGTSTPVAPGIVLLTDQYTTGTITITNNVVVDGKAIGSNLLTMVATNGLVSGFQNGSSATYSGSGNQTNIAYTSAFVVVPMSYNASYSTTFGSLSSGLSQSGGLNHFGDNTASGNGAFNGDPTPSVPEPASIALIGLGLVGAPLVLRRRRKTSVVNS